MTDTGELGSEQNNEWGAESAAAMGGELPDVDRSVGSRDLGTTSAHTVRLAQTMRGSVEDVWDACTNIERIPRWFLPVTGELKVGGHYQLEGNAHGVVESCDPPHAFRATWENGDQVSWIEVTLTEVGPEETTFELLHVADVPEEFWTQFGPGAVGVGWDLMVGGLRVHLATHETVRSADAFAWMASPQGISFIRASADAWRDAQIANGEDPDRASTAAEASYAFYTTAPEPTAEEAGPS